MLKHFTIFKNILWGVLCIGRPKWPQSRSLSTLSDRHLTSINHHCTLLHFSPPIFWKLTRTRKPNYLNEGVYCVAPELLYIYSKNATMIYSENSNKLSRPLYNKKLQQKKTMHLHQLQKCLSNNFFCNRFICYINEHLFSKSYEWYNKQIICL